MDPSIHIRIRVIILTMYAAGRRERPAIHLITGVTKSRNDETAQEVRGKRININSIISNNIGMISS